MIGECWSHDSGLILFGHSYYNILSLLKTVIILHFQVPLLPYNSGIQCIKELKGHPFRKNVAKKSETSAFTLKPGCFVLGPAPPAPRHLRHHRHHHNIDSARPRVASGWPLLSTAAPRNTFRCSRASSPPWEKYGKARKRKVQQGLSRTRPRFQAKLASRRQKWKLTESQIG